MDSKLKSDIRGNYSTVFWAVGYNPKIIHDYTPLYNVYVYQRHVGTQACAYP